MPLPVLDSGWPASLDAGGAASSSWLSLLPEQPAKGIATIATKARRANLAGRYITSRGPTCTASGR